VFALQGRTGQVEHERDREGILIRRTVVISIAQRLAAAAAER